MGADRALHSAGQGRRRTCSTVNSRSRPQPEMDRRFHLCLDLRGLALRRGRHRPIFTARRRLVDKGRNDGAACRRRAHDGDLASRQAGRVLHHSDQGSQYASEQFRQLMADNGVVCSMSRSGNVRHNAAMESFFSSLKTERVARKVYRRREEARSRVRRHRAVLQSRPQAPDHRLSQSG
jgi:transposase InsO family protein